MTAEPLQVERLPRFDLEHPSESILGPLPRREIRNRPIEHLRTQSASERLHESGPDDRRIRFDEEPPWGLGNRNVTTAVRNQRTHSHQARSPADLRPGGTEPEDTFLQLPSKGHEFGLGIVRHQRVVDPGPDLDGSHLRPASYAYSHIE